MCLGVDKVLKKCRNVVADGHIARFAYRKGGTEMRIITSTTKKPWAVFTSSGLGKQGLMEGLNDRGVGITDDALEMIVGAPAASFTNSPRRVKLACVSLDDIGFGPEADPSDVLDKDCLAVYDLRRCTPDVVLDVCARYEELFGSAQPQGESLRFGMQPIARMGGGPHVFAMWTALGDRDPKQGPKCWLGSCPTVRHPNPPFTRSASGVMPEPFMWRNNCHLILEMIKGVDPGGAACEQRRGLPQKTSFFYQSLDFFYPVDRRMPIFLEIVYTFGIYSPIIS